MSPLTYYITRIYLVASDIVASIILDKKPIFFIRKKLTGGDMNYTRLEKITLALVHVMC